MARRRTFAVWRTIAEELRVLASLYCLPVLVAGSLAAFAIYNYWMFPNEYFEIPKAEVTTATFRYLSMCGLGLTQMGCFWIAISAWLEAQDQRIGEKRQNSPYLIFVPYFLGLALTPAIFSFGLTCLYPSEVPRFALAIAIAASMVATIFLTRIVVRRFNRDAGKRPSPGDFRPGW